MSIAKTTRKQVNFVYIHDEKGISENKFKTFAVPRATGVCIVCIFGSYFWDDKNKLGHLLNAIEEWVANS